MSEFNPNENHNTASPEKLETIDVQFTEHPENVQPKAAAASDGGNAVPPVHNEVPPVQPAPAPKPQKEHKSHPILTVVLCAIVSLGAGFGGGYLAGQTKSSGGTTVIYKEAASTSDSNSNTTVATSSSGMTIQQIAAKATPSVVEIVTEVKQTTYGMFGGSYTSEAAGSGVIISSDGYIVTNNHVIEDATSIKVTVEDGTEYTATLVGTDSKSDIAVIKIDATGLTAATIGDSDKIAVGDTAVVIGNPLGTLGGTVTNGIISATDRELTINNEAMNLIQTNAAINSGNSGGGLFDSQGDLIGIVNAKDSGTTSTGATIEGLGFAIPINDAMDVAQQLMSNGYVADRATLGVYVTTLTQDQGNYKAGVYVTDVISGGGAEKAGLQAYDRITAVDGEAVSTYQDLSKILKTHAVGDTVKLTIVRDDKEMDIDVTLGASQNNTETTATPESTPIAG
jgi:serine protease Do